jgi:hypothetical protein
MWIGWFANFFIHTKGVCSKFGVLFPTMKTPMIIVNLRVNKSHMDNTQSNDKDDDNDVPLMYLETIHFNKYMVTTSSDQDTLVGLQFVNSMDWDDDDDDDDDDSSTADVDIDDDETKHQHRNSNNEEGKDYKLLDDTTTQPTESTIMDMYTPTNNSGRWISKMSSNVCYGYNNKKY